MSAAESSNNRRGDTLDEMVSSARKRRDKVTFERVKAITAEQARVFIAMDWQSQPAHMTEMSANPLLWWKEVGEATVCRAALQCGSRALCLHRR